MRIRELLGFGPALPEGESVDLTPLVDTAKAAHDHLRANIQNDRRFAGVICRALGCGCDQGAETSPLLLKRSEQIPTIVRRLSAG